MEIVNGNLPENYLKLNSNHRVGSLTEETQLELDKDHNEEECESRHDYMTAHDERPQAGHAGIGESDGKEPGTKLDDFEG